jgi:dTDP-4-dehydrorhamnose reductase
MKALITGSDGQLGTALRLAFRDSLFTDSSDLDITDKTAIEKLDTNGIEVIINAAAYTNVDGAENPANSSLAEAVNSQGVANLAQLATRLNIPLVHFSSDYVFDGTKVGAYTELDPFKPVNAYGRTKAEGDQAAMQYMPEHLHLQNILGRWQWAWT